MMLQKKIKQILAVFFSVLFASSSYSQLTLPAYTKQKKINQILSKLLDRSIQDTTRCRILIEMIEEEEEDKVWPRYNAILKNIALKNLNRKINKDSEKKFIKYLAEAYNNYGYLQRRMGKLTLAIQFYEESLRLREKIEDRYGIALSHCSIGQIYYSLDEYEKAIRIFRNIVYGSEAGVDEKITSWALNDWAGIYRYRNKLDSALILFKLAYKMSLKCKDIPVSISTLNNIGACLRLQGKYKEAKLIYNQVYEIIKSSNYKSAIPYYLLGLINTSFYEGKYSEAKKYAEKGFRLAQQLGHAQLLMDYTEVMTKIYEKCKDDFTAFKLYKQFTQFKDSLNNFEAKKAIFKRELNFEYFKKSVSDSLKLEEEKNIIRLELKHAKKQLYPIYGGLFLVVFFSVAMVRRFKVTCRQKRLIEIKTNETEFQKHLVEEKQKEIMDSIYYAKRLQDAILPPLEFIQQHVKENFIIYNPKDIVSGDFYWAEAIDDLFFIAVADSLGNGVPGAMISVVCSNALNRSIKEFKLHEPGKILDQTRSLILDTFVKSNNELTDRMDLSLLCIDKKNRRISWSGANNRILFIHSDELKQIKGDKQSVHHLASHKTFTTHHIEYKDNTTFYLFTNGFTNQFGGKNDKKFGYKNMTEMFLQYRHLTMDLQKEYINNVFDNWKGKNEQIDDVCVLGIRL